MDGVPCLNRIPAAEFQEIKAQKSDYKLLTQWYRRDDNSEPCVYELQPRTGEWCDPGRWSEVESTLKAILKGVVAEKNFNSKHYNISATEQEILQGATVPDAAEHVFCFFQLLMISHTMNGPQRL